ncbi:uncharacterized protein JCM6883_005735 [Sporobolomyces salmoneus]|uniref:uncharacterized protein n=1 Tax=Sporobolomyces salmoneus TaxID=183962 RepID=UPI00317E96FE
MPPKLTQPLRPFARYRKGQAPVGLVESDSDSDQESETLSQQQQGAETAQDEDDEGLDEFTSSKKTAREDQDQKKMGVKLGNVKVDQQGTVKLEGQGEEESSEYETDSEDEAAKPPMPKPTFNKPGSSKATAPAADDESSEYETDSEEEEEPLKPIYKPVFVSKRNRDTIVEREKELDPEIVEAKRTAEIEKQKEQSKNLVADSIVRELAQKETEAVQPDVDDTDGLDPEGEFEEWKLRELTRLKRDKEARYALEKVKEEVEARRSMPEALRLKEDTERAEKSRKEKKKGSQVFLQKYHHKGAFHQDQEILQKHDYTAPTISTVDVSSLPSVLQKRNFGKMSQSKYTHLADQDTSRKDGGFGGGGGSSMKPGAGGGAGGIGGGSNGNGCFNCGGPHLKRDCPQLNDPNQAGPSGSNSSSLPSTSRDGGWGSRPSGSSHRDDERRGGDLDRPSTSSSRDDRFAPSGHSAGRRGGIGFDRRDRRDEGRRRSRSRSRSRSPPRSSRRRYDDDDDKDDRRDYRDRERGGERDSREYDRRDRRRSRSRDRDDREKRRRVD